MSSSGECTRICEVMRLAASSAVSARRMRSLGGRERLADGDADRDARAVAAVLHAHRVLDAVGEAMPGVRADARQDRGELVAAQPVAGRARVGCAQRGRDGADALVADGMAEALVRLLEAVEVEHDEADAALRERVREVVVERAPVAQAGERIGRRGLLEVGELGVRPGARAAARDPQQHEERGQHEQPARERRERQVPGVALLRVDTSASAAAVAARSLRLRRSSATPRRSPARRCARTASLAGREVRAPGARRRAPRARRARARSARARASCAEARLTARRRAALVVAAANPLAAASDTCRARTCARARSVSRPVARCAQIERPVTIAISAITVRITRAPGDRGRIRPTWKFGRRPRCSHRRGRARSAGDPRHSNGGH